MKIQKLADVRVFDDMPIPETAASTKRGHEQAKKCLILLLDQRPLMRALLTELIENCTSNCVVVAYSDIAGLVENFSRSSGDPCLVILNIGAVALGASETREKINRLRQRLPDIPLVILCEAVQQPELQEALRQGVRGLIPTTLNPPVVLEALRLVLAGGTFIPEQAVTGGSELPQVAALAPGLAACPTSRLTLRQKEVLKLLRDGKPNKVIAYELNVQESTVKVHIRHILLKLGATNRTVAALRAPAILGDA